VDKFREKIENTAISPELKRNLINLWDKMYKQTYFSSKRRDKSFSVNDLHSSQGSLSRSTSGSTVDITNLVNNTSSTPTTPTSPILNSTPLNSSSSSSSSNPSDNSSWLEWDEMMVANQLFLFHLSLLSSIPPRSCLAWVKTKDKEKCPEIWKYIQHFNQMVLWVVSEIVVRVRKLERVALIEKFINIANLSLFLNDFLAAKAFLSGVTHPAVSRMTGTLAELSKESKARFEKLQMVLSLDSDNGAQYRAALQKVKPPYILYLGLHFKDMTFIIDGNPSFVSKPGLNASNSIGKMNKKGKKRMESESGVDWSKDLEAINDNDDIDTLDDTTSPTTTPNDNKEDFINTTKFTSIAKIVLMIQEAVSEPFTGAKTDPELQRWFSQTLPFLSDDQIFWWSKRVEPRNTETMIGEFISKEIALTQEVEEKENIIKKLEEELLIQKEKQEEALAEKDGIIDDLMKQIEQLKEGKTTTTTTPNKTAPKRKLKKRKSHINTSSVSRNKRRGTVLEEMPRSLRRVATKELQMLGDEERESESEEGGSTLFQ